MIAKLEQNEHGEFVKRYSFDIPFEKAIVSVEGNGVPPSETEMCDQLSDENIYVFQQHKKIIIQELEDELNKLMES